jgi:rod shape-determining protein MreD
VKFLYRAVFVFILLIVQFSVFPRFWNIYFEPDLLLIVIVLLSLNKTPEWSCLLGFFLGLMMDVNTGEILGSYAFTWTQIAMVNASIRKYLIYDSIPVHLSMTATSYLLAGCIQFVLLRFTVTDEPAGHYFLLILSRSAITAFFAWPLSVSMSRLGFFTEAKHA